MAGRDGLDFGAALKRYRLAAGLTQEELAERAHLSVRAITDLERGVRRTPRPDTVALLVGALSLTSHDRTALEAAARQHRLQLAATMTGEPDTTTARPEPGKAAANLLPTAVAHAQGGFLGAVPTGPLVGREPELRRLLVALDGVAGGQGQLVLLAGEPGVGKTRLAQQVMLEAQARGVLVLIGRCYEQHAALPFFPFVEALTSALTLASPALRQEAPRLFPYLGLLLPELIASPPTREGEDLRLRILRAVGGFVSALAVEAPVALLLDDLHCADSASLELLLHLARQTHGGRVLLLGTYRDLEVGHQHPLAGALAELLRERLVTEISLRRLSCLGTAALIGAHFRVEDVSDELRNLVHSRAEGNPFFTEEILKALVEQGAIFPSATGWDRQAISEIDVPRSVRTVVGQRVARLVPEAQELLRMASVLGQEWDLELLLGTADLDQETVLRYVEAALAAKLLEERRVGRRERFGFVHALIGQALYDDVPRFRLRKLHRQVGETLERAQGEQPEAWAELARHFLAAGEEERATHYALRAGDHAASLYGHAEAVQQYEMALALLKEARDLVGTARTCEKLGAVLSIAGRYDAALKVLDQAAETFGATGDLEGLGRVTAAIGMAHAYRGTGKEGIARLEPVLQLVETHGILPVQGKLRRALLYLLFHSGQYAGLYTSAEQLAHLARAIRDDSLLALAQMMRGMALNVDGSVGVAARVKEVMRSTEEAIRLAEAVGDLEILSQSLHNAGYFRALIGEFAPSRRDFQRAGVVAERRADPTWIAFSATVGGWVAFLEGDWDQARVVCDSAVTMVRQASVPWVTAYVLANRGAICLAEGQWEEASRYLEEACTRAGHSGDLQALRFAAGLLAELEILAGRPAAAQARLVPLLDRPGLEEYNVTAFLPVLAWAHLELGEVVRAADVVEQALRRTRPEGLRLVLVEALRVQAMVAVRLEQWQGAERALEEGLSLARSMAYPYAEARLLHLSGRLYTQLGKPEAARERLAAALAIFQRLGAHKDIQQVERDLAAHATEG
jgi:tetratricopeptide (TPR) repeat protein/DNA-binding XRE family transcriptional regulator